MASFTFGAGNARKLLGLPLYACSAVIGLVVPRSDRLWVFGSGIGLGEGALPLFRLAQQRLGAATRLVWLARGTAELEEARAMGFEAIHKDGLRGFWTTLRARVIVVTHGFGDANRYGVSGGIVVQLWHGLPFKHLHLDSPSTYSVSFLPDVGLVRRLLGLGYRRAGHGLSLFPVSSARVRPSIVSGFGIRPENVVVTGDPRDDVLLAGDETVRRRAARTLLDETVPDLPPSARVVLFAPTWRDGAADPTVPSAAEWDAIVAWLDRHDAVLLVRTHPLGRGSYADGPARSSRIRLLGPDLLRDVNPVLWAVDAVVTDYSSIVFDFALVGRPVVFYAPDLVTYTSTRGFYVPFGEFTGGRAVTTWSETLDRLAAAFDEAADGPAHRHARHLREEFFDVLDGHAADRVLDEILDRTGLSGGSGTPETPVVRPAVTSLSYDPTTVTLSIGVPAGGAVLVGRRASVEATGADGIVAFDLLASRWGFGPLALPSDTYRLELSGSSRVDVTPAPLEIRHELFRATVREDAGGLVVEVAPPLADDERGPEAQRRLEKAYRSGSPKPENAVFLESFRGRSAACNPRGIDRALAGMRPSTRRYWSVIDGSVPVPAGSVRLIEGSREWWRVRGAARVLVVNDWLRKRFRRRPHQHVLQTWHGSTLKRLARDRPDAGPRTKVAATREGRRWDALLAQNEFSAEHLASAYAFRGPVWVEGYPRNDVLTEPDQATEIRRRLGVDDAGRVVLYAPTWREDRTTMVDHLDVAGLARALGPGHVLLVRGHSSTWEHGRDHAADGLVDVTGYPDVSDLLLVTDVLVTDYSSVMFDWVSTGRPIVFFVPDRPRYRGELRGFYADLLADAPGPVVETADDLLDEVLHAEERRGDHAVVLHSWQQRFAAHDDGEAGQRVVHRMIDAGWLDLGR
ncbi:MAG: CDP-glycerol glycerophosphotransferase family protein [Aeromicrobium sp.]